MENGGKKKKLSLRHILYMILFGLLIIIFKYYLIRVDPCRDSCSNINSEIDLIKCLDACSINAEDYREPISNTKIMLYSMIVILFFFFLYNFINNDDIGNNNLILHFLNWVKKIKDKVRNTINKRKNK